MIGLDWFNADRPYDEDAELTRLEQANQRWLNSVGEKYMKPVLPPVKADFDVYNNTGNEDAEESEESHDADEEEEMPTTTESPHNEMESESPEDGTDTADLEVEATMWPYVPQEQ